MSTAPPDPEPQDPASAGPGEPGPAAAPEPAAPEPAEPRPTESGPAAAPPPAPQAPGPYGPSAPQQPQYAQPQYGQQPPGPPPYTGHLAYQARPQPQMGGRIWLGLVIALVLTLGVPAFMSWLISTLAWFDGWYLLVLPVVAAFVLAIVFTCIPGTRRTGIGMWVGIAALPIIGLGTCVALLAGVGY